MLCTSDMYTLINYVGFINYLFYGVTVAGQIVLRIKQPDMHRPIKVCFVGFFFFIKQGGFILKTCKEMCFSCVKSLVYHFEES